MKEPDAMAAPTMNFRGIGAFRFLGVPTQVRAAAETTKGAFGLIEHWEMPPGFASPYYWRQDAKAGELRNPAGLAREAATLQKRY